MVSGRARRSREIVSAGARLAASDLDSETLVATLCQKTGVQIHAATMNKALKRIGARRGRPKPTVNCPWSKRAKNKRLRGLQPLIADSRPTRLPCTRTRSHSLKSQDWLGLDGQGPAKGDLTPGQNEKRYLAGAEDTRTGEIVWVEAEQKNSFLFILLLWELVKHYPDAKRIHVILDNYAIHTTEQVEVSLQSDEDGA